MKLLIIINIEESNDEIERNDNDVITYIVMMDIVSGKEYSWSSILEDKLTEIH